jgi:hypothetical protein
MFKNYLRLMLDEGAAGGGATGGDPSQRAGGLIYETWIAEQPETVRAMLDGQTSKLKSALTSERERSKGLEKDLRDAASKAEKGSEAEKRLNQLADQVQAESKKSAFYESAVAAGVNNLKLAFLAATQDDLFKKDGSPDFDALKKSYPELFGTTQSNGAGEGSNTPDGKFDMDAYIRNQLGAN